MTDTQKPIRILLIRDGDSFWNHQLSDDQPQVHIAYMDVTGKNLTEDYPIIPLIVGGGTEEEVRSLSELAVNHANSYRASGHLEKDITIARLQKQVPVNGGQAND